jgi:hypothetical protein
MQSVIPTSEARRNRLTMPDLDMVALQGRFAVCRLEPSAPLPGWARREGFLTISWSPDELSVVCAEDLVPDGVKCERGWRALKLQGPFDFALTGILLSVLAPLAEAKIGIFAVSTFDTDYVMVKDEGLERAIEALRAAGHRITAA